MGRTAKSYNRSKPRFKPQPTVLVICEDSKSGKRYIEDATKHYRVNVKVLVMHAGRTDPKGIVEEALRQAKHYDQVFCAIDRDTHETFDEALRLARGSAKIDVIASYPCIEFWYLLHFGFNRRGYVRAGAKSPGECAIDDLRRCRNMEGYAKGAGLSVFDGLQPLLEGAIITSERVLQQAVAENEFNPSTRMHVLMKHFQLLSTPQLA
ncbi:RloB family protein [Pseudoduganella sp. R-43]|uniref:RloB family protein n=1 Tax=Pseudoduganella sp. R-43 TaxID=3404063 RepID=UPI003CF26626